MTTNKTDDERRITVDREEYDAMRALEERVAASLSAGHRAEARAHDLELTCRAQARRLVELDLVTQNFERVCGMQRVLIDHLREARPGVGTLEELTAFWRSWVASTDVAGTRDEVGKVEPDLFRSWRLWVRDSGRASRTFALAGSRVEVEQRQPATPQEVHADAVDDAAARVRALNARVQELTAELETIRASGRMAAKKP